MKAKRKTLAEFQKENAAILDKEWLKKYPNGRGFLITCPLSPIGRPYVSYGWLTGRPTSSSQQLSGMHPRKGYYQGRSFYRGWKGVSHEMFDNEDMWAGTVNSFLEGNG